MKGFIVCIYESRIIDEHSNRLYSLHSATFITPAQTRHVIYGNNQVTLSFTNHHDMREFVMKRAKENDLEIVYVSAFGSYLVDNIYYIIISGNCIPEKFYHNKI